MQKLKIHSEVPSKKNSYRSNGKGGLYKPKKITDFEKLVADEVMVQRIQSVQGAFTVTVHLHVRIDRDLDNAVTTILDALQETGVIVDDKDCFAITAYKHITGDGEEPYATVTIKEAV